jgi:hypothetical protein
MLPPAKIPDPPSPDTALPTMNMTEEVADALTTDPIAKVVNEARKMDFIGEARFERRC